jgi:Icc-related predicted phosphoesterase
MKVLALADLHGEYQTYEWMAEVAARTHPDVLVLAGDLLGFPDGFDDVELAQKEDAKRLLSFLDNLASQTFYIMGNGDMIDLEAQGERICSINMARVETPPFNFVGYQYCLLFMGRPFEKTESELQKDLEALAPDIDDRTVFVTHSPAYGVMDRGILGRHTGSQSILSTIKKCSPYLHIHGHTHIDCRREGIHFNVASAYCKRATLIDLSNMRHEVITG